MRGDVLDEVAVRDGSNGVLTSLPLPIPGRIITVSNRSFLAQRPGAGLIGCERAVRTNSKPALPAAGCSVFQEIGLGAARPAANPKAGQLVIPSQDVSPGSGLIASTVRLVIFAMFLLPACKSPWQPSSNHLATSAWQVAATSGKKDIPENRVLCKAGMLAATGGNRKNQT